MKKRSTSASNAPQSCHLMRARFFAPFFWTQAAGAFNDNLFKQLLLLSLTYIAVPEKGWDAGIANNIAAGLFIVPFLLFSAWGGVFADCLDKQRLIRALKWLELAVMLSAALMLWLHAYIALLSLLFIAGVQAALFGPAKYAILPQHVPGGLLVSANAWVELGTFLAILLGTLLAGWLFSFSETSSAWMMGGALIGVSVIGLIAAYRVPPAPPVSEVPIEWRPIHLSIDILRAAWRYPPVFRALIGISLFWLIGASYLTQLPLWVASIPHGDSATVSFMLAAFAIGIGAGSLLCANLSAGRIEVGFVALGAVLIGIAGLDFAQHSPFSSSQISPLSEMITHRRVWWYFLDLSLIGIGGGFYIVPLYLVLQTESPAQERSRMIAANNILNAIFMIFAAVLGAIVLGVCGASINYYFTLIALIALVLGGLLVLKDPCPVIRICVFMILRCCYRLKMTGRHNIPASGPAIVVCNHVSYMDALLLGGTSPRLLRFMMDTPAYENPWLNWFCRIVGAIPVDLTKRAPKDVRRALNEVSNALRNGEVVMLFPEGRLTRDGEIGEFRRGVEKILLRDPVPVIPAAMSGLWGSWGSYKAGRPFMRLPTRLRRRVRLGFGEPIPPKSIDRHELRRRIVELKRELGGGK